ncbi:MAG: NifB/NifX family molybdenum-iron cluster-binding protein [Caldisericaceae bacterium]
MKICFTSDEQNGLESIMSYHFGHCPYFVIVDVDGTVVSNVESIQNPLADEHNAGDLPSFMKERDVDVIIAGGMGPKAREFFESYGIQTVIGAYGKVKDVLEEYLHGKISYNPKEEACCSEEENNENEVFDVNEEINRMKKDIIALRKDIADLKSLLLKIEKEIKN